MSPEWDKATVYSKGSQSLIELPLHNSTVAFVPFNTDSSKINLNSNYARTSYVISKDSFNRMQAWFMVLIADTSYIEGNFAKLELNTYKSRDKDFSGRLLYYTPTGKFLAGWRYEKGVITKQLSSNANNAIQTWPKQQVNVAMVCMTYPVTTATATCVTNSGSMETNCTYTYTTISITECYDTSSGGGGGGVGDGGGVGGGGGTTPGFPPPPTPPDCPPILVSSVNGKQINLLPGDGGAGGGDCDIVIPELESEHDENLLPKNKLCSSTFKFTRTVAPNANQGSRGWKQASVANLVINVVSDNYFENIWNTITTGNSVVSGTFNLEIGVPGDLPDQAIIASTTWAANITIAQLEKSYGIEGLKNLINSGTLGYTVAKLMQIQLQSEIPGSRVGNAFNGQTTPTSPVTGINCK